ncbi:MAG TPA: N-acyl homoserine lactonase family protein [Vicinamibacterales bacterium]|nr:N-acyl homoserine lactonase family protein [Vicinamibacterales bacterium]
MSRSFWSSLVAVVLLGAGPRAQPAPPAYEVYAVRFADVPYSLASLVAGAERGRSIEIAFTVWVVRDPASARVVLVDAGFYRAKFLQQWHPNHFVKPSDAVMQGLGIAPDAVTDIIVSHSHWDHADGVDLFPRAKIWIQKDEYEYYVGANGEVLHRGGVDADDAKMIAGLTAAGRVGLVDGDDREILPGIRVYTGGKHTFASQFAGVSTRAGTVILASDNAYLYENLEKHLAIAQTLDAASNLAAQDRMLKLAATPRLVVPGHDPAVFERFPVVKPGVVRID